jgi:hypothetical protein
MSYVFDCTKATGITCAVPTFIAGFVCDVMTAVTGRFHDHSPVSQWEA